MASTGVSKLRYAVMLAAGLAHLALTQRDAAGITLFADHVVELQSLGFSFFEVLVFAARPLFCFAQL